MKHKMQVLGYSENNNTIAFQLVMYNNAKKKFYLGVGTHNFISGITKVCANYSIPNCKEEIIKTLSTNDFDFNVSFIRKVQSKKYQQFKEKFQLCKF